jgi:hypothetical protein
MKRHQILWKDSPPYQPVDMEWIDECFAEYADEAAGRGGVHPYHGRCDQIRHSMFLAAREHLGQGPIDNLASRLNFGMDCAVDYYLSDWFAPEDRVSEVEWFAIGPLQGALFLAGMTERWDDLEKICAWLRAHLDLEGLHQNITEIFFRHQLPLCLLSSLGAEPIPGVDGILAAGLASKNKYLACTQHTWRAWEAALAGNQKAFDAALKEALKHFLRHDIEDTPWAALDASCVWMLAERRGLKFPKLTEKQDAAVVRRETVGLVAGVDPRPRGRDGQPYPEAPPLQRHEVLNRKPVLATEQYLELFNQDFAAFAQNTAPGQPQQHINRQGNLWCCMRMVVLEHLGCGPVAGLADRLNYGMDRAVEYFCGDWYHDDEAERDFPHVVPELRRMLLARVPFWHGLLFGGLTGRWADVERIAGSYNAHIDLASQGPLLESIVDESHVNVRLMQMQLVIAAGLAPVPIPGVEELVAHVKGDETPPVESQSLLCALWETVLAKNQTAFDKAFHDKTRHFIRHLANQWAEMEDWVDLHTSAVSLVAQRNGLALPALTLSQDAVLVRRQTIGLA